MILLLIPPYTQEEDASPCHLEASCPCESSGFWNNGCLSEAGKGSWIQLSVPNWLSPTSLVPYFIGFSSSLYFWSLLMLDFFF